ncbi:GATS protein-like 3 [Dissophora ornata]|nr:GATS protein-like 3 [Dissophora ornata]
MPECDLIRALDCLATRFSISNKPLKDAGLQPSSLQSWDESFPMCATEINSLQDALLLGAATTRSRQSSLASSPGENGDIGGEKRPLRCSGSEDSGIGSEATSGPNSEFKRDDRFFSFTQTDSTLSIIMDGATMSLFPDHTLNMQAGAWRLISIGDGPLGFDECGVVNEFSRPLSERGVGVFYLSTFSADYIMVNDQDFDRAIICLEDTAKALSVSSPISPISPLSPTSPILPTDPSLSGSPVNTSVEKTSS